MARIGNLLLAVIYFNGKYWYLSNEGYSGEHYYAPYISSSPRLTIGQIKGNYVGVQFGKLTIANVPYDEFSPFSIYSGGYAEILSNPNQLIPLDLYWGEQENPLFTGNMSLDKLDSDNLSFFIENVGFEQNLLDEVRDVDADLITMSYNSISGSIGGTTVTVIAAAHGLLTGDKVNVSNTSNDSAYDVEKADITYIDANTFTYNTQNSTTLTSAEALGSDLETFEKRVNPFAFGNVNLKGPLVKVESLTTNGLSKGDAFANPNLKYSIDPADAGEDFYIDTASGDLHLQLFDDALLVGTTDSNAISQTVYSIDYIEERGNTAYAHITAPGTTSGLVVGDQVDVKRSGSASSGDHENVIGTKIITSISTNKFTYQIPEEDDFPHTESTNFEATRLTNYFGRIRLPTDDVIYTRFNKGFVPDTEKEITTADTTSGSATVSGLSAADYAKVNVGDAVTGNGIVFGAYVVSKSGSSFVMSDAATLNQNNIILKLGEASGHELRGTAAITGTSRNGKTVLDFFTFIKNRLYYTIDGQSQYLENIDISNAPEAVSEEYQLWQESQVKVIEYAGNIAERSNYIFQIVGKTLKLFKINNTNDEYKVYQNYDVTSASFEMPFPIEAVQSIWEVNTGRISQNTSEIVSEKRSARIDNLNSGEIVEVENVTDSITLQREYLRQRLESDTKVGITLSIGYVDNDVKIGDRVKTIREEEGLSIDMNVRSIEYDFDNLETSLNGEGTLRVIELDSTIGLI